MRSFFAPCFLASVFLLPSSCAEPKSVSCVKRGVYVKIILPGKLPPEDNSPTIEPWILKGLEEKGEKEVRAVTDWVSLSQPEGESARVWNAVLNGKTRGCPVDGLLEKRTVNGKLHVVLSGWTPVGPTVETRLLPAKPGSREIIAVDLGDGDSPEGSKVIAYAVLSVGLPEAAAE